MNIPNKVILTLLAFVVVACGDSPDTGTTTASSATLTESFTGADNDNWSTDWTTTSGVTATRAVDIQTNRGHLQSNVYDGINSNTALTRVYNAINLTNANVVLTVEFENFAAQGFGIYLRQNGGYLTDTVTNGQGYGVFWEGNSSNLGFWTEIAGVETLRTGGGNNPISSVLNNTQYKIRYQVQQDTSADTYQRVKIWLASSSEPANWDLNLRFSDSVLQNISGGIAIDLFNYSGTASIYVDDIVVTQL